MKYVASYLRATPTILLLFGCPDHLIAYDESVLIMQMESNMQYFFVGAAPGFVNLLCPFISCRQNFSFEDDNEFHPTGS